MLLFYDTPISAHRQSKMETNDMSVFKSYLRNLLRRLKELEKAFNAKDEEKVKELIKELIEDTQSGIED